MGSLRRGEGCRAPPHSGARPSRTNRALLLGIAAPGPASCLWRCVIPPEAFAPPPRVPGHRCPPWHGSTGRIRHRACGGTAQRVVGSRRGRSRGVATVPSVGPLPGNSAAILDRASSHSAAYLDYFALDRHDRRLSRSLRGNQRRAEACVGTRVFGRLRPRGRPTRSPCDAKMKSFAPYAPTAPRHAPRRPTRSPSWGLAVGLASPWPSSSRCCRRCRL